MTHNISNSQLQNNNSPIRKITSSKPSPAKTSAVNTAPFSKKIITSNQYSLTKMSSSKKLQPNQIKNDGFLTEIMSEVRKITNDQEVLDKIESTLKETNKDLPNNRQDHRTLLSKDITLFRGCRPDQLAKMLVGGSAGGLPANANTGKPSEEAAKTQVGEGESLPEFTSNIGKAKSFGTGQLVVAMSIKKSNLTQGSETEAGMVCNHDAPVILVAWRPGTPYHMDPIKGDIGSLADSGHKITDETKEIT
jgi:hypothetical protein